MMIAFPPCTALCNSGNRWYAGTDERSRALDFIRYLMAVPIPRWAIENPVGAVGQQRDQAAGHDLATVGVRCR